ncbi:MAG: glycosyltransferase family 4 protein [Gaiellaceae bacterium]
MRVLIVSAHFRPHVGGIERFSETLAEGLSARGHDVRVLCCRTDAGSPPEEGGPYGVRRVPSSAWPERRLGVPYPLPSPLPLVRTLRRELAAADVVHVQDALYASSVAALLLARRRGVPSLLTQHVAFVPQGAWLLDAAQHAAVATLGRAARLATEAVALNAEVAGWAERRWGIARVGVAPVGTAAPEPVDRDEARRELGLDPERFVALFVGRDVPKKGLDVALAAAGPEYDLVAVTDRTGPVAPGARLLPFMVRERLERLYAAADVFLLPSEAEGIPVALQEAMASGLPVVTPYAAGYTGTFLPTDIAPVERTASSVRAALLALAADPAERERLAARSRAVAASAFSWEAFVDAYERLLRELAG